MIGKEERKIQLVFERGSIISRDQFAVAQDDKLPVPPGQGRGFAERQYSFDLFTYDRLRVVTTELRRLVSEGRPVELCLGPSVILGNHRVEKALRWV